MFSAQVMRLSRMKPKWCVLYLYVVEQGSDDGVHPCHLGEPVIHLDIDVGV